MAGPRNKDSGWTPLHLATYAGHKDIVEMLVRGRASVNARTEMGLNPLYLAAQNGEVHVAKLLIDFGSNVNQETRNGCTPLSVACGNGQTEIVDLLISHKANVDQVSRDSRRTSPVGEALENGFPEVVQQLAQAGAKLNVVRNDGYCYLYTAVVEDRSEMVETLVSLGCDVNTRMVDGLSCLQAAAAKDLYKQVPYKFQKVYLHYRKWNRDVTMYHIVENNENYLIKLEYSA